MCMLLSVAYSISVCECNCINVPRKQYWCLHRGFVVPKCWETSLYDIMTHSHFDTWHHNKISKARRANNMTHDSKSVNLTHFRRLSICSPFSRDTSHSHDNLRRVSTSPLLHPFTCRRSGTLDWRVTRATSADSSRLIHTILAHSSTSLSFNLSLP
jgi:hypothetical protein